MRPSAEYWLGTDSNGQDIFWQATFAIRNSLIISLIAGLVSRVIAILVGMIAGYKGGATDRILMFISDSLLVIPLFLIFVMLAMLVREHMNLVILGLLLSIFGWVGDYACHHWIGRSHDSHPGHDAELGTLLPVYSIRTLVVGPDPDGLI